MLVQPDSITTRITEGFFSKWEAIVCFIFAGDSFLFHQGILDMRVGQTEDISLVGYRILGYKT